MDPCVWSLVSWGCWMAKGPMRPAAAGENENESELRYTQHLQRPEEPAQSSAGRAVKGPVGVRLPEHGQGVGGRGGHGAAGTGGVRVVELWLAGGSCELLRREVDGGAAELPGAGRQDRAGPGRKRKMSSYQIWFIGLFLYLFSSSTGIG